MINVISLLTAWCHERMINIDGMRITISFPTLGQRDAFERYVYHQLDHYSFSPAKTMPVEQLEILGVRINMEARE